jgi:hypothetical protein
MDRFDHLPVHERPDALLALVVIIIIVVWSAERLDRVAELSRRALEVGEPGACARVLGERAADPPRAAREHLRAANQAAVVGDRERRQGAVAGSRRIAVLTLVGIAQRAAQLPVGRVERVDANEHVVLQRL